MLRYIHLNQQHIHIPAYKLFIGLGISIAFLLLQYDKRFRAFPATVQYRVHQSILISIICGFVGAYALDTITQQQQLFSSWQFGLTFWGGLIGGSLIIILCFALWKIPIIYALNLLTPYFVIAHFFGRIGCFMAGCCFGKPTNFITGFIFPENSLPYEHYHALISIHPTQLYEAIYALGMFFLLKYNKYIRQPFFVYLITYCIFRFGVEYLRDDDRGTIIGNRFSPSQQISISVFFVCIIAAAFIKKWQSVKRIKSTLR